MKAMRFLYLIFFLPVWVMAQAPEKISYQAVIRNSNNLLLGSKAIAIKIGIIKGKEFPEVVYEETQKVSTNVNGLMSLQIGAGQVILGSMSKINWATGLYYIKTEIDPEGGNNYIITGLTELTSVPFALFAATSGGLDGANALALPGPKGDVGAVGPQGLIGLSGVSGTQGPTGLTGDRGATGANGADGATGAQGVIGLTGASGAQGPTGNNGAAGATGPQGSTGATGSQGPTGLTGAAGAQGPAGSFSGTFSGNVLFSGNLVAQGNENSIGTAGTVNGNGVRIGNGRFTFNKPLSPITFSADVFPTAEQIFDAGIFVSTNAFDFNIPSASSLVSALPGGANKAVGDVISILLISK
jgi:hypothetical protein